MLTITAGENLGTWGAAQALDIVEFVLAILEVCFLPVTESNLVFMFHVPRFYIVKTIYFHSILKGDLPAIKRR